MLLNEKFIRISPLYLLPLLSDDQGQEHAVLPLLGTVFALSAPWQSGTVQRHQALVELVPGAQGQDVALLHVTGRVSHHGEPPRSLEVLEEPVVVDGLAVGSRLQPDQQDLLGLGLSLPHPYQIVPDGLGRDAANNLEGLPEQTYSF